MKTKRSMGDDHILYGMWDSDGAGEVLVRYHPNGVSTSVFVMIGMDYGGGVSRFSDDILAETVDKLWKEAESDSDFYDSIVELTTRL